MNRQAIIVLGMHRSGTSAFAGALGMLGMRLPARLMPAAPENPKGFFEPSQIVSIHERLLASLGLRWFSCRDIPETWFRSAQAAAFADELATAVREDYGDAAHFVVKDPRLCRLVPLWREVLTRVRAEGRFAIPLRHPHEVAQSLAKRNGLPAAYSCALWLRHLLEAERHTRGARRVFVHFNDLLEHPERTAESVASRLTDNWQSANGAPDHDIASFIDPAMQHAVAEPAEQRHALEFDRWVDDAVDALSSLASDPDDAQAQRRLDKISSEFDAALASLAPVMEASELIIDARARAQADLGHAIAARSHFEAELGRMRGAQSLSQAELDRLSEARNLTEAQLTRVARDREYVETELGRVIKARDYFQAELGRMTEARDHLQVELGRMTEARDYFQAELGRMTEARDYFQAELGRMTEARDYFQAELGRMTEARDYFQAELGRMTEARDYFQAKAERKSTSR